jgi:hypothetical protein
MIILPNNQPRIKLSSAGSVLRERGNQKNITFLNFEPLANSLSSASTQEHVHGFPVLIDSTPFNTSINTLSSSLLTDPPSTTHDHQSALLDYPESIDQTLIDQRSSTTSNEFSDSLIPEQNQQTPIGENLNHDPSSVNRDPETRVKKLYKIKEKDTDSFISESDSFHSDDSSDDCVTLHPPKIRKPSERELEILELSDMNLARENPHYNKRSKYEFNLLNLRAYRDNWDCLDYQMQRTIREFINSDLKGNCFKHGMKRINEFYSHLLLLIGVEVWNIRAFNNTDMVSSNLRNKNGNYSMFKTKNTMFDSRSCYERYQKFMKKYSVEDLLKTNNCQIVNFESSEVYRSQNENSNINRELYKNFFKENVSILKKLQRSGLITGFLYSNEVSADSILKMRFRPHTHALVFFPKTPVPPDLGSKLKEKDRTLKALEKVHTSFSTMEKFVRYMFASYSLSGVYEQEYTHENVLELNKKTVEAHQFLFTLTTGDVQTRSFQRNNHSKIPKRKVG